MRDSAGSHQEASGRWPDLRRPISAAVLMAGSLAIPPPGVVGNDSRPSSAAPAAGPQTGRGVQRVEAAGQPSFGTYHALLIGIDDYRHWQRLGFAERDAAEIALLLTSIYDFRDEHVDLLLGREATRENIVSALQRAFETLGPDDNLLIYYAGHGYLDELDSGYWIPFDGRPHDESGWIPFSRVQEFLHNRKARVKNVALLTDSCYGGALAAVRTGSGPDPDRPGYRAKLARLAALRSREVYASGGYEAVPDRSRFAELLKRALEENPRPTVALNHLFSQSVLPKLALGGTQEPRWSDLFGGGENGRFVLVKKGLAGAAGQVAGEFNRSVTRTRKDPAGAILALCQPGAAWSPRYKTDVIRDIESGLHRYFVPWPDGAHTTVRVVGHPTGKYLRTDRDDTPGNNLRDLPDC